MITINTYLDIHTLFALNVMIRMISTGTIVH